MDVERADNGGFPEPVAGEPVRLVRARHDACGASTRVRVPRALPARAVRRIVCAGCRQPFEVESVEDDAGWLSDPRSRAWKYLSIPAAAAAVVAALLLLQGGGGSEDGPGAPEVVDSGGSGDAAELVNGSSYTLALPGGWGRTQPDSGATFAASARDGGADATLWVQNDPSLDFPRFESQSLDTLRGVAGSAHVEDRTTAPTAGGTIVTLAADPPAGGPAYEVTLRVAGPYRYYLATTVEPDASPEATDGAELIHNSFVPVATEKTG